MTHRRTVTITPGTEIDAKVYDIAQATVVAIEHEGIGQLAGPMEVAGGSSMSVRVGTVAGLYKITIESVE